MTRIAYVNGRYVDHARAAVHIEDRGYQFSDGVYEYIAFYNRVLLDGDLHLKRLARSLREIKIAPPMSQRALALAIAELIGRNTREDGGLYMQITRGVARRDHPFPAAGVKPSLVMTVCAAKLPKPEQVRQGVGVITAPDQRWARRDIKSISLLANILARQASVEAKAREVWLLDEKGIVTEGSASNAYIVTRKGELVTHPANHSILGGITRDVLLALARKEKIPVAERPFSLKEAMAAEEAFLTSTSANVLPVVRIDGKAIGGGKVGQVTRRLLSAYLAHVKRQTGRAIAC